MLFRMPLASLFASTGLLLSMPAQAQTLLLSQGTDWAAHEAEVQAVIATIPFAKNPQSFQRYANGIRWSDGVTRKMTMFSNCGVRDDQTYMAGYYCMSGYVSISDPMGIKVCRLARIRYMAEKRKVLYDTKECRYR